MSKDTDLLRKVSIIADLDDDKLQKILKVGRFVRFKAGDTIMHEGENADTMYLFVEGTVDVTKNLTLKIAGQGFGHAEKSMTRLKAGTAPVFGEMSMFGDEPRSATIVASDDCLLFEVSREAYDGIGGEDPTLGLILTKRMAAMLSSRVRKGNDDVLKLSTALSIALSR
ncbi:MAG: hypothetical protein A3J97_07940 [Spirochaetes bacterium RIFOXYC1_FULL_54_7]|nr:MAG: hypothetical protein A3J97_07940 [Spirochaetes bacterium RIFOXYC1_FULL_54_7]